MTDTTNTRQRSLRKRVLWLRSLAVSVSYITMGLKAQTVLSFTAPSLHYITHSSPSMDHHQQHAQNVGRQPNSNAKRPWSATGGGQEAQQHGHSENQQNRSPWQAFKRLRVTHADEDGDLFMHSPSRLVPQAPLHAAGTPQQQYSTAPTLPQHQTAGQETQSEQDDRKPHATTSNRGSQAPVDPSYQNVNHVLGQLHQQRMEREQRQAAVHHNGYHQDAAMHHSASASARTPIGRPRSPARATTGGGSFHTPPRRQRKVVHLHTDSKLR